MEKLLYNISQVNDSITKQMYLETLAIKEKEIDNFENLKLIFKRLEAQILHLISSLKNIRSQIINLLLLELEINKFKSSNILQSIEELDNNIITIEEVLSYQYN